MTKYFHIVQVHPVELGEPNVAKVKREEEFVTVQEAQEFIADFNSNHTALQAVYVGRVNDTTGELE